MLVIMIIVSMMPLLLSSLSLSLSLFPPFSSPVFSIMTQAGLRARAVNGRPAPVSVLAVAEL